MRFKGLHKWYTATDLHVNRLQEICYPRVQYTLKVTQCLHDITVLWWLAYREDVLGLYCSPSTPISHSLGALLMKSPGFFSLFSMVCWLFLSSYLCDTLLPRLLLCLKFLSTLLASCSALRLPHTFVLNIS